MVSTTEKLNLREFKLTEDVFATLRREYGEFPVDVLDNSLDLTQFDEATRQRIITDIDLHRRFPNLPLENLCSTFGNFEPELDSQRDLLESARKLANYDKRKKPAGVWVYGTPGLGKTHIGIGFMKELMNKRNNVEFMQFPNIIPTEPYKYRTKKSAASFIDEVNSLRDVELKAIFLEILLTTYNTNGRMYVASNITPEAVINSGISGSSGGSYRYIDRIRHMFKIIKVEGDTHRKKAEWLDE